MLSSIGLIFGISILCKQWCYWSRFSAKVYRVHADIDSGCGVGESRLRRKSVLVSSKGLPNTRKVDELWKSNQIVV